jgi:hypothetical protein
VKGRAAAARKDSPKWAAIDGELTLVLGRAYNAKSESPAVAVLILRDAIDRFQSIATEEAAAREAEAKLARQRVDDARLEVQREGMRAAWAERVGKETVSAVSRMSERLQRARERLGAMSNEAGLRDVLSDIGEATKSMNASLAFETRASIDRESAEAARCGAKELQ